jgi:hypothetical protein
LEIPFYIKIRVFKRWNIFSSIECTFQTKSDLAYILSSFYFKNLFKTFKKIFMKTVIVLIFAILFAVTGKSQTTSGQDTTHHTMQTHHKKNHTTKTHQHNYSNSVSHRNSASGTNGMESESKSANSTMSHSSTNKTRRSGHHYGNHKGTSSTSSADSTR